MCSSSEKVDSEVLSLKLVGDLFFNVDYWNAILQFKSINDNNDSIWMYFFVS